MARHSGSKDNIKFKHEIYRQIFNLCLGKKNYTEQSLPHVITYRGGHRLGVPLSGSTPGVYSKTGI